MTQENTQGNGFLPLGSIVILKGAIKKLMIASRANIFNNKYFDYGGILYPEGIIDENIAYFNGEDIVKIVWEGFMDEDNALIDAQLLQAKKDYAQTGGGAEGEAENGAEPADRAESAQEAGDAPVASAHSSADPFAALKEMEGDEE